MKSEEIQMNKENQKAIDPVELTEVETDRVSGGNNGENGNHYGQLKEQWLNNPGKAGDAPGHNK
jgi:hypothetical protein